MTIFRLLATAFAVVLPLAACTGGEAAPAGSTVRDSAGIAIVESTAPAWGEGEGWRLAAEPSLVIGSDPDDPNTHFASVADVVRLGSGALAVADGAAGDVRLFDPAGRYLRTVGKKGSGPGEFQQIASLFRLPGDSLGVWDIVAARLSVFDPSGRFARDVTVRPEEMTLHTLEGVYPDGALLVSNGVSMRFKASETAVRDTATYRVFSPAGEFRDTVGRFPGDESFSAAYGGGVMRMPVPFGRRTVLRLHGTRLFHADGARYEIAERDPAGRVVRLIRRVDTPEPLTPAEAAQFRREQLDRLGAQHRPMYEAVYEAMPFPAEKGPFEEMLVDAEGNLWLSAFVAPGSEAVSWTVFDGEGRWLGSVTVPRTLRIERIGADHVIGVERDELDVQRVVVYPLLTSPAS